jgi:hypothetical protein
VSIENPTPGEMRARAWRTRVEHKAGLLRLAVCAQLYRKFNDEKRLAQLCDPEWRPKGGRGRSFRSPVLESQPKLPDVWSAGESTEEATRG